MFNESGIRFVSGSCSRKSTTITEKIITVAQKIRGKEGEKFNTILQ